MILSRQGYLICALAVALAASYLLLRETPAPANHQAADVTAPMGTVVGTDFTPFKAADSELAAPLTTSMPGSRDTSNTANIAETSTNVAPIQSTPANSGQNTSSPAIADKLDHSVVDHPYQFSDSWSVHMERCRKQPTLNCKSLALNAKFQSEPRAVQWAELAEDALFKFIEGYPSDPPLLIRNYECRNSLCILDMAATQAFDDYLFMTKASTLRSGPVSLRIVDFIHGHPIPRKTEYEHEYLVIFRRLDHPSK